MSKWVRSSNRSVWHHVTDYCPVKSKLSDGEIAYVTFHSMDDALATKKACAALFPHLEVTLTHGSGADRSSRAEDFAKPTDTICVVGYDGTQEEFRKFFDEFRLDIHDVRRRTSISLFSLRGNVTGF